MEKSTIYYSGYFTYKDWYKIFLAYNSHIFLAHFCETDNPHAYFHRIGNDMHRVARKCQFTHTGKLYKIFS